MEMEGVLRSLQDWAQNRQFNLRGSLIKDVKILEGKKTKIEDKTLLRMIKTMQMSAQSHTNVFTKLYKCLHKTIQLSGSGQKFCFYILQGIPK